MNGESAEVKALGHIEPVGVTVIDTEHLLAQLEGEPNVE
jgi:hypothetical protein